MAFGVHDQGWRSMLAIELPPPYPNDRKGWVAGNSGTFVKNFMIYVPGLVEVSLHRLRMEPREPSDDLADLLTTAEMHGCLAELSEPDQSRLEKISRHYADASTMSADDILAEALVRALDGTRKCPRGVNLMVFLARAMKSIAWADRTSAKTQREIGPVEDRPADTDLMGVSTVVGLEEQVIQQDLRKKQVDALMALFHDDQDATLWLMARMDAESLEEMQALTGFGATKLNTVGRRIRRKVERKLPHGLRP
jgi:DNA-directed RNA polymerase specialized sigma24 family protein